MKKSSEDSVEEDWADHRDWADQVEEESKEIPRKDSDIEEERVFRTEAKEALWLEFKKREEGPERYSKAKVKEMAREFIHGLRSWRDFKPRRVQALCACEGIDETHLSFEPGAVMTEVRPAAWMQHSVQARWLEGALDGRVGLIHEEDVKYLDMR